MSNCQYKTHQRTEIAAVSHTIDKQSRKSQYLRNTLTSFLQNGSLCERETDISRSTFAFDETRLQFKLLPIIAVPKHSPHFPNEITNDCGFERSLLTQNSRVIDDDDTSD